MAIAITDESQSYLQCVALDRLVFGWWNTSLSPIGKARADDNHKEIASAIVASLIDELKVDCLALGEVTNADLSLMARTCKTTSIGIFEGTLREGRLQFDTGVLYNSARLSIADSLSTTSTHGVRNYKIANRIDFIAPDGLRIHVFVSHWPSRATSEETSLSRKTIAGRLRDQLRDVTDASPDPAIIVMGDFNDEPFDESLSWHLLATRDRHLVQTKKGYLYNPFWRKLGQSRPYARSLLNGGPAGTCFYKTATETRWRTFDQILFSSAFFGKSMWHLREEETIVLTTEFLIELINNDEVYFDHFPVLAAVERFGEEH
jgi:endonuclease/exonuclease/phosphatase family metal-dependent hydrolase